MALFRVMTWNVENLFGVGDADGPATEAAFAAKIESLRAVIDAQRPHVLALQEIGREDALATAAAGSHAADAVPAGRDSRTSAGSGWRS